MRSPYNNIAPIAVALALSAVTWLFGGARGDILVPVAPWLLALMVEVLVCFPQRCQSESIYAARARVWSHLKRSPVVWTAVGLLAVLLIPFVNNGLCPGCDAALIAQGANPKPPLSFLPFCVNRIDHLYVVLSLALTVVAAVAVRHSMTQDGKRLILSLLVWNGAALAVLGFVQAAADAPGPFWIPIFGQARVAKGAFFSVFGYPNMAGDYFTLLFGISVALWRHHCGELEKKESALDPSELAALESKVCDRLLRRHYLLIPAAVFFFAAVQTLSRAALILVTSTACVYFAHTQIVILHRKSRAQRLFAGVWSLVGFLLVAFFVSIFIPKDIQREVDSLGSLTVLDRVTGKGQYHVDVAYSLWRDHPLFGCGGWGYKHFCVRKMDELKIPRRQLQRAGGANVHNDYLQALAEHGIVGLGALVALAVLLLVPVFRQWRALIRDENFKKERVRCARPVQIFALPSAAFILLVACLATLVHAFGDCPLRAASILALPYVILAALPGFLPVQQNVHSKHHSKG